MLLNSYKIVTFLKLANCNCFIKNAKIQGLDRVKFLEYTKYVNNV